MNADPQFVDVGVIDYSQCWQKMIDYVDQRDEHSADQVWYAQHPPVFTLGRNGKANNLLASTEIPLIRSDRGGDITYHGPGQVILYVLIDLRRWGVGVKRLVELLEQAIIDWLREHDADADRLPGAPGVYVQGKKIASLGLRVRHGYSYHGIALNVNMDLAPFSKIHPCGLVNMRVTQVRDLGIDLSCNEVATVVYDRLVKLLKGNQNNGTRREAAREG